MKKKEKIILIGGGGYSKACIDVIEQEKKFEIVGIIDERRIGEKVLGYPIVGSDQDLERLAKKKYKFLISLGQIGNVQKRIDLFNKLKTCRARLATVFSPLAYVSRHAEVMEGTIVMDGAIVNAGACVGKNCIINTKALIEHDAQVGCHCHVSTGAIINGGVVIGEGSFIGSGAVSKQSAVIGKNSFIKANSIIK